MKKEERKRVGRVRKMKWKKEETREDTRYGDIILREEKKWERYEERRKKESGESSENEMEERGDERGYEMRGKRKMQEKYGREGDRM